MSNSFTARTPFGLVLGTLSELAGSITFDDFQIDENISLTLTINDPSFEDATTFDYRICELVNAIQDDFLGIYNQITGDKITTSTLRHHPELIVKVRLKQGSVIIETVRAIKSYLDYTKNFAPEQKMKALKLTYGIVALGCITYLGGKAFDYVSTVKIEDTRYAIRKLELAAQQSPIVAEAARTAQAHTRTTRTIATILTDNGTVKIGEAPAISGKELRFAVEKKNAEDLIPAIDICHLDGHYKISCQNYEDQTIRIRINKKVVWASTASLSPEDRKELKAITDRAVDTQQAQTAALRVTVELCNGVIKSATITGVGNPRPSSIDFYQASQLATKNKKRTQQAIALPLLALPQ